MQKQTNDIFSSLIPESFNAAWITFKWETVKTLYWIHSSLNKIYSEIELLWFLNKYDLQSNISCFWFIRYLVISFSSAHGSDMNLNGSTYIFKHMNRFNDTCLYSLQVTSVSAWVIKRWIMIFFIVGLKTWFKKQTNCI